MKKIKSSWRRLGILAALGGIAGGTFVFSTLSFNPSANAISREVIAPLFKDAFSHNQYPTSLQANWNHDTKSMRVRYTFDPELQKASDSLLKLYHPDYGILVTVDPNSGAVLSMTNFVAGEAQAPNLALRASFPSASVFKIVTATAAIDRYGWNPDDEITYNGANHTLYKKNVDHTNVNRWSRTISLRQAFAESINTVFAKIGVHILKPADLREYSQRYGFNRNLKSDMPVDEGVTLIPDEEGFKIAEIASGFTRTNRMSPVQGAMIAASAINGGQLMSPYIVDTLTDDQGQLLYQARPEILAQTASPEALAAVRRLMATTIDAGTALKSFRPLRRDKRFADLEMGGKTGSLMGDDIKGKTDWFVGYAKWKNRSIAVAALTVNKEVWRVKSAVMAELMFKQYYQAQADILYPRTLKKRRAMASN